MSRVPIRESKGPNTSVRMYNQQQQYPLANRVINDGGYLDPSPKSSSRQFQSGIFKSNIGKKIDFNHKKNEELDLQIMEVQIPSRGSMIKNRTCTKAFGTARQSRQSHYFQNMEPNMFESNAMKEEMAQMSAQVYEKIMEEVREMMGDQKHKNQQGLESIVNGTRKLFKKTDESVSYLKGQNYSLKDDLGKLSKAFYSFSKETEQKMENLVMEIGSMGGVKKSKAIGQYGMDLKSSFQGLNSSLSVNFGNETQNSKLVNEVIFQLDTMKKEIADLQHQIGGINSKMGSRYIDSKTDNSEKSESTLPSVILKEEEIIKLIKENIGKQKKGWKIQQKLQAVDAKMRQFEQILFNQQNNIKGINDEFANAINLQLYPKMKKMEAVIGELFSRTEPLETEKQIKAKLTYELNERLKDVKTIRIRSCRQPESQKLSILSGTNEERIGYKQTYLLDQENYLLDSEGNYLVEQVNGQRKRIRLQSDQLYLLQLRGIQVCPC